MCDESHKHGFGGEGASGNTPLDSNFPSVKIDQGIVISGLDYMGRHEYYLWIYVGSG